MALEASSGADEPAAMNVAPATSSLKPNASQIFSNEATKKSSHTIAIPMNRYITPTKYANIPPGNSQSLVGLHVELALKSFLPFAPALAPPPPRVQSRASAASTTTANTPPVIHTICPLRHRVARVASVSLRPRPRSPDRDRVPRSPRSRIPDPSLPSRRVVASSRVRVASSAFAPHRFSPSPRPRRRVAARPAVPNPASRIPRRDRAVVLRRRPAPPSHRARHRERADGRLDRYRARRALADARRATRDVCGADAAPRIERFARRDGIQMTVGLFAHTLHRRFESRTVD
tara:strand:+ start:2671 stop:3540 length:870 start_codon:yes stop_codon:yes gene_type:complete